MVYFHTLTKYKHFESFFKSDGSHLIMRTFVYKHLLDDISYDTAAMINNNLYFLSSMKIFKEMKSLINRQKENSNFSHIVITTPIKYGMVKRRISQINWPAFCYSICMTFFINNNSVKGRFVSVSVFQAFITSIVVYLSPLWDEIPWGGHAFTSIRSMISFYLVKNWNIT